MVSACGAVPSAPVASTAPPTALPPALPEGSPQAERWLSAQIELSHSVTDAPSGSPPALCSPCHAPEVSIVFGVANTPFGLIATGVERPPATIAIWRSTDSGG